MGSDRLDEILAAMKAAGDRLKTLTARFEQTNHDFILDMEEVTSGSLYAEIPGKIRWEYDAPVEKVLLVTGDKIRLYIPTARQVHEFEKGQMRGGGADLLIGFGRSNAEIGKNYDVHLIGETDRAVDLELVPKPDSTASIFKSIELTMEKKRWVPLRSVFHEPNRDTTLIQFQDVEVNASLPPDAFDLDLPAGVEIIKND